MESKARASAGNRKTNHAHSAPRTVVSSPGQRPPYQALTATAPRSGRKGLGSMTGCSGSDIALPATASTTASPYFHTVRGGLSNMRLVPGAIVPHPRPTG